MENSSSSHYLGDKGKEYFQNRLDTEDDFGQELNASFYLPYLKPGYRILDFGCGSGKLLEQISHRVPDLTAEGYEINPGAANSTHKKGFRVYSQLSDIPADTQYDVIYSNHVLEHISDVVGILQQLRSFLKPDGRFITMLPIDDYRTLAQQKTTPNDIDNHLHSWTPRQFANVLYEAGLQVETCKVITSAWHPKLFPLIKIFPQALYFTSVLLKRRQLFALARL